MDERATKRLSPEEAGAFVAQWAEQNAVTVEELARTLGVEPASLASLSSQSKGRLSMERSAATQKRSSSGSTSPKFALTFGAIGGLLLGGLIGFLLLPKASSDTRYTASLSSKSPLSSAQSAPGAPSPGRGAGAAFPGRGPGIGAIGGVEAAPGPAVSGGPDPRLAKSTPNRSANAAVEARGISIPDDLLVAIHLPTINYIVKGKAAHNAAEADALKINQIAPVVDGLIAYALESSPPDTGGSGSAVDSPRAEVQVKVGRAFSTQFVPWTDSNRMKLESMYKDASGGEAKMLIAPLLDQISKARVGKLGNAIVITMADPASVSGAAFAKGLGIPIPDDLTLTLLTPGLSVSAMGKPTQNPTKLASVKPEVIGRILNAMLSYVRNKNSLLADDRTRKQGQDVGFISLGAGNAGQATKIQWIKSNQESLSGMFKGPKSTGSQKLINPFLDKVHKMGPDLFRQSLW